MGLLIMTFAASFTGYLLPWDQLSYWAITVGTNIASYAPVVGDVARLNHGENKADMGLVYRQRGEGYQVKINASRIRSVSGRCYSTVRGSELH